MQSYWRLLLGSHSLLREEHLSIELAVTNLTLREANGELMANRPDQHLPNPGDPRAQGGRPSVEVKMRGFRQGRSSLQKMPARKRDIWLQPDRRCPDSSRKALRWGAVHI